MDVAVRVRRAVVETKRGAPCVLLAAPARRCPPLPTARASSARAGSRFPFMGNSVREVEGLLPAVVARGVGHGGDEWKVRSASTLRPGAQTALPPAVLGCAARRGLPEETATEVAGPCARPQPRGARAPGGGHPQPQALALLDAAAGGGHPGARPPPAGAGHPPLQPGADLGRAADGVPRRRAPRPRRGHPPHRGLHHRLRARGGRAAGDDGRPRAQPRARHRPEPGQAALPAAARPFGLRIPAR